MRGCRGGPIVTSLLALAFTSSAMAAHSSHGCQSCHVPHTVADQDGDSDPGVPLWSDAELDDQDLPVYELYSSATLDADDLQQPDGPSKMCLGCHDGSYGRWMDADRVFEADELANTHPISFTYDSGLAAVDGHLHDPTTAQSGLGGTIREDLLDRNEKMQCTSCHDVHTSGIGEYLLRYDWNPEAGNDQDLCRVCHEK